MIQPLRRRASARTSTIWSATSASSAPRPGAGRVRRGRRPSRSQRPGRRAAVNAVCASSITTSSSVDVVGPALRQPAPGGDLDRRPTLVEADPAPGGQRRDIADAGDDLDLEGQVAAVQQVVEDRERAVVERRVAPDRNDPTGPRRVGLDHARADFRPASPPVVDRLDIGVAAADPLRIPAEHDLYWPSLACRRRTSSRRSTSSCFTSPLSSTRRRPSARSPSRPERSGDPDPPPRPRSPRSPCPAPSVRGGTPDCRS